MLGTTHRRRVATMLFGAVAAAVLVAVAATAWAPPAEAHDHKVPKTVLREGSRDLQTGLLVAESFWNRSTGEDECEGDFTQYVFRFPKADRVAPGSVLRVRIFKDQRPDSFAINAHRKVDDGGFPIGELQPLRVTLEPVVRKGKRVAWDAGFRVGRSDRDHYLVAEGHWRDQEAAASTSTPSGASA